MTDLDLLGQYIQSGSQQAFTELVRRHIDMVYATCLRRLRNRDDAQDAAQIVFAALAAKASTLARGTVLAGWLYRAADFVCRDMVRMSKRRREHERAAGEMRAESRCEEDLHRPEIDSALARLSTTDRHAIVLRYLEERSIHEVAGELRLSEAAARKRLSRALERLRGAFMVTEGSAFSLIAVEQLLHASLHPAPAGFLDIAAKAALSGAARTGGTALAKGATAIMATTKLKTAAGLAAILLLSGGAVVGYKAFSPPANRRVVISEPVVISQPRTADQEWNKRFMDAYQLAPDQIVKFVDRVPVPERLQYWNSQPNTRGYPPLTPESTLILKSNGSDLHWINFTPGWIPLAWAISFGAKLQGWQVDHSIPQGMKFTGDWVFRENASPEQTMDALAALVSQRLGRDVRFVKRSVVRDVLVARGTYKFVPLAGYANDNIIIQFADGTKPDGRFVYPQKLSDLFNLISMAKAMYVIDETGSGNQKVRYYIKESWHDPDVFLRTIAAQTSIRFDAEPRQLDVWFMVDSTGTTMPSQP